MTPVFSFILPSFNRATIICEALESVRLEQEKTDLLIEVLVCDDFSNDNTQEVIQQWCTKNSIHWVSFERLSKKSGVCVARNNAINRAKGEFLVFLDSDDQIQPGALSHILSIFRAQADVGLFYGAIQTKSGRSGVLPGHSALQCVLDFKQYIALKGVGEFLPVCRRTALENPRLRFNESVNGFESILWLKLLHSGTKLWIDPKPLRLYDDLRTDRLCHPENLAKDSERLAHGFFMLVIELGDSIHQYEARYWQALIFRTIFYGKVSGIWDTEFKAPLKVDLNRAPLNIQLTALIPRPLFSLAYPFLNPLRRIKRHIVSF